MTLHKACKQFARWNQQVSSFHTLKSINKQNTCLFVTHNRVSWQQTIIKWTAFLVTLRIYKSLIDFWKKTQSQLEEKIVLGLRYGLILSFTRHLLICISINTFQYFSNRIEILGMRFSVVLFCCVSYWRRKIMGQVTYVFKHEVFGIEMMKYKLWYVLF